MATKNNPIQLADLAFKKPGPLDAGVNALLNIVITWFLLADVEAVTAVLRTPNARSPVALPLTSESAG